MSESDDFGYPVTLQAKILAALLFDPGAAVSCLDVASPDNFDHPALQDMAAIIIRFFQKYRRAISLEEFETEFSEVLERGKKRIPEKEYKAALAAVLDAGAEGNFEYAKDKFIAFSKFQAVKNAIADAGDVHLRSRNYEEIMKGVREAMEVGESGSDLGVFYFDNLESRLSSRADGITRADLAIRTGSAELDRALGGGLGPGELGIIMGPMKRGKTMFSVNLAYGAMSSSTSVVHYIMEGSEDRLQVLYDARVTGVPKESVVRREWISTVRDRVEGFHSRPGIGQLIIKHFSAQSCSPLSIESHLNRLSLYGVEPGLLIIDYLGLMVSSNRSIANSGDRYLMYGQITKELLGLAQRKGYAIWLLHQSTRGSKKKATIDLDDSADSIEPMRDADLILTLNQPEPPAEAKEGEEAEIEEKGVARLRIFVAGGREVADRVSVDLTLDKKTCVVREIGA